MKRWQVRGSAPDSDSCAGCHNEPEAGGAGDFVANVFVLAQVLDPVTLSVSPARTNGRNTLGMHGSGPIEMLAREMTADLQAQRAGLPDGTHTLTTKGVNFEIAIAGGEVVEAEGIDTDLIVKPFHQAGKVISLREFSTNAMNHHHGMQAEERFDLNPAKFFDPVDPDAIRWFCNEQLAQGRADQDGKPGTEFFLTRKLWDVGNTAPYGHRGDVSTITEAILLHGGEGRASRDAFASAPVEQQKAIVAFLKTLQIVPQK